MAMVNVEMQCILRVSVPAMGYSILPVLVYYLRECREHESIAVLHVSFPKPDGDTHIGS